MTRSDLADLSVIYQTSTERAVCVRETEDSPDVWLPLSEVEFYRDDEARPFRGDVVTLTGPEWLMVRKGLL